MFVWIVWGEDGPVAVFSSEQRAQAFIARHEAQDDWLCSRACVNLAEGLHFEGVPPVAERNAALN